MSLESDIKSLVKSVGLEVYDIMTVNENDELIYRINVTSANSIDGKRESVSLDQCVALTHLLSPLLDVTPPISGEYRLEVGSAGIERKLNSLEHFKKSIGDNISIVTIQKLKIRGTLVKVEGSKVFIQSEDATLEIEYSDISKAKTYFEW